MKKSEFCEIFCRKSWQKKINKNNRQNILSLNIKSTTFSWKISLNFSKIGENLVKKSEKKVNKINRIHSIFSKV